MARKDLPQDAEVLAVVRELLDESPYPAVRNITCERRDGVVVLRGRVPSYYLKQLALSTTIRVQGLNYIDDRIDVVPEHGMFYPATRCARTRRAVEAESNSPSGGNGGYCPWVPPHRSSGTPAPVHELEKQGGAGEQSSAAADFDLMPLRDAADDGDVCAMYRYGHKFGDSETGKRWLRNAAQQGCVPAIHECALATDDPEEAIHWLREAAEEGYVPAMLDYARTCSSPSEGAYWLQQAARRERCGPRDAAVAGRPKKPR